MERVEAGRNLLFGLLALQVNFIDRAQLQTVIAKLPKNEYRSYLEMVEKDAI